MRRRSHSYLYSCNVTAGLRTRALSGNLDSLCRALLFSRVIMFLIVLNGFPYSRASSAFVFPCRCCSTISSIMFCGVLLVPFCLGITKTSCCSFYSTTGGPFLSLSVFTGSVHDGNSPFFIPPCGGQGRRPPSGPVCVPSRCRFVPRR